MLNRLKPALMILTGGSRSQWALASSQFCFTIYPTMPTGCTGSVVFFVVNVALFVIFTCISVIRYTMYPEIWGAMIRHPTQSLFLGTFPMGFATIVNMVVFVCVPSWGPWATTLAWTMWWIDVVVSTAICFYLPFVMFVNIFRSKSLLPIYLLIIGFGI